MTVLPHFRFTVRGEFTGTPEEWSFGFHFGSNVDLGPDASVDDIHADQVTTALTSFIPGGDLGMPTNAKVNDWRAYKIKADGNMEGEPLQVDLSGTGLTGGVSPKYPPQIACVVTTVAATRGPARFGRFYLPTGLPLGTDRRVSVVDVTAVATAATAMMKAISDAIDFPLSLDGASGINVSELGGGVNKEIDHLEVGRVLDTLRNRRKSMVEERHIHGHIDW
jgi:hypothetical protein